MLLSLNNCMPDALKDSEIESDVWGRELSFRPGECVQLLAPSAKGKTTLISYLYGIRFDYSGSIRLDDSDQKALKPDKWALVRREKMAVVFQDLRLFDDLSGLDNIMIKARLTNYCQKEDVTALGGRLGMKSALDKHVRTLSWGEKQRVAILRALVQPFDWLLLDEPFSHLDADNRERAIELIAGEVKKRKAGILLTCLDENRYFRYGMKVKV
ncbi:MAG: ATP-binding cassette domain-containing protein [Spirochaetales bacterium]|nr:ATP-binding cassette domain-containing protein [Spirochaetales bacterium]